MYQLKTLCVITVLLGAAIGFAYADGENEKNFSIPQKSINLIKKDERIYSWDQYHSYNSTNSMVGLLFDYAATYPDLTKLISIGKTWQGRDIFAIKISDNADVEEDEPEVLFDALHHAREWLTTELALYIVHTLLTNYTTNATIKNLVDNRQIWVIPMMNPDGRVVDGINDGNNPANTFGDWGWRKNARDNNQNGVFDDKFDGVDLNRNYGFMWGQGGSSPQPWWETYMGPAPFSEPETNAFLNFTKQHKFITHITYHTFSQLILHPWGYTFEKAPEYYAFLAIGEELAKRITNKAGSSHPGYTVLQGMDFYKTTGTTEDFMYGEYGTISFTIELYPHTDDYIAGDPAVTAPYNLFHPKEDKILPVCEDNIEAALYMIALADNPFKILKHHLSLQTDEKCLQILPNETKSLNITVINDGELDDTYEFNVSPPTNWLVAISTHNMFVKNGERKTVQLDVTSPENAKKGLYHLYLNATSLTNNSVRKSIEIELKVPYKFDVAVTNITPFVNFQPYPPKQYTINATVVNNGWHQTEELNVSMSISEITSLKKVIVFEDKFDAPTTNWYTQQDTEIWMRGKPTYGISSAHSPPFCWGTVLDNPYPSYANAWLISPEIKLPIDAKEISLEFYHLYDFEYYSRYDYYADYGAVWLFANAEWHFLKPYGGTTTGVWESARLNLTSYRGCIIKIAFQLVSDEGIERLGWYIDDVKIVASSFTKSVVYVETTNIGNLSQFEKKVVSWKHDFSTSGWYLVSITVSYKDDEYSLNNVSETIFEIPPYRLTVRINASKTQLYPYENAYLEITVTNNTKVVENAFVHLTCTNGTIANQFGYTNESGVFSTIFSPPAVVTSRLGVIITVNSSKPNILNGSATIIITIQPLYFEVSVKLEREMLYYNESMQILVTVKNNTQPLANAVVELSCKVGELDNKSGFTDENGVFRAVYTASVGIYEPIYTTIKIVVSKNWFVSIAQSRTLFITPYELYMNATIAPPTIYPGESAALIVTVDSGKPVTNAYITISVSPTSSLIVEQHSGYTDEKGAFKTMLTARTVSENTVCSLIINASKVGYSNASAIAVITVKSFLPLELQISAPVSTFITEANHLKIVAKCNNALVENVSIKLHCDYITFARPAGFTDEKGVFETSFVPTSCGEATVTVYGEKYGYLNATNQTVIIIQPYLKLFIQLTVTPLEIKPAETATVQVVVTDSNGNFVEGATVLLNATLGRFEKTVGETNRTGVFRTTYIAPVQSDLNTTKPITICITARAMKEHYDWNVSSILIKIKPEPEIEKIEKISWQLVLAVVLPAAGVLLLIYYKYHKSKKSKKKIKKIRKQRIVR